jgi:hypothetical protein
MHILGLGTNQQDEIDVRFLGQNPVTTTDWRNVGRKTIDILFDDVLLEIFDFLVVKSNGVEAENWWRALVHVCRKWRNVVFGSTHRLNLQLVCSDRTPVRETLDFWPPLPILIHHIAGPLSGGDSIIAALKRIDRICQITLKIDSDPLWKMVLDAMQESFPVLTHLILSSDIEAAPVIPVSFMGGSAPRLQDFRLKRVQIPGIPKLLLSATDLVHLVFRHIPHFGYILPEAIVTCLSTLLRLEMLYLVFESRRPRPNSETRRPPPLTRSVLPALTKFTFFGVSEYLEDLVARIDCPLLDYFYIVLFHQPIFDTPQLIQFISRTPTLKVYDQARLDFSDLSARVTFPNTSSSYHLMLEIFCRRPERRLSSMVQICTSSIPRSFIHMVGQLYIRERRYSALEWQDGIENSQWLELLRPFTAVKDLYLSKEFAPCIAPCLQELVGGRTTEVLPALQSIFLDKTHRSGPFEDVFEKLITAEQLSNRRVAISRWKSRETVSNLKRTVGV